MPRHWRCAASDKSVPYVGAQGGSVGRTAYATPMPLPCLRLRPATRRPPAPPSVPRLHTSRQPSSDRLTRRAREQSEGAARRKRPVHGGAAGIRGRAREQL